MSSYLNREKYGKQLPLKASYTRNHYQFINIPFLSGMRQKTFILRLKTFC